MKTNTGSYKGGLINCRGSHYSKTTPGWWLSGKGEDANCAASEARDLLRLGSANQVLQNPLPRSFLLTPHISQETMHLQKFNVAMTKGSRL